MRRQTGRVLPRSADRVLAALRNRVRGCRNRQIIHDASGGGTMAILTGLTVAAVAVLRGLLQLGLAAAHQAPLFRLSPSSLGGGVGRSGGAQALDLLFR